MSLEVRQNLILAGVWVIYISMCFATVIPYQISGSFIDNICQLQPDTFCHLILITSQDDHRPRAFQGIGFWMHTPPGNITRKLQTKYGFHFKESFWKINFNKQVWFTFKRHDLYVLIFLIKFHGILIPTSIG